MFSLCVHSNCRRKFSVFFKSSSLCVNSPRSLEHGCGILRRSSWCLVGRSTQSQKSFIPEDVPLVHHRLLWSYSWQQRKARVVRNVKVTKLLIYYRASLKSQYFVLLLHGHLPSDARQARCRPAPDQSTIFHAGRIRNRAPYSQILFATNSLALHFLLILSLPPPQPQGCSSSIDCLLSLVDVSYESPPSYREWSLYLAYRSPRWLAA